MLDKSLLFKKLKAISSTTQQIDIIIRMSERAVGVKGEGNVNVDPLNLVNVIFIVDEKDSFLPLHHELLELFS
jgi:hypothetical protein